MGSMTSPVLSRSLTVAVLAAAWAVAGCGAPPQGNETPESTSSAVDGTCSATTTCTGIIGAPPDLIVTCPQYVSFYTGSPSGGGALVGKGETWTFPMSDYQSTAEACTQVAGTPFLGCQSFSTYAPPDTWCPGTTSGSGSGGGSTGGKFGCKGTCQ